MHSLRTALLPLVVSATALAGCASSSPVSYVGLQSTGQLVPNPQDKTGHVPFLYAVPDVAWVQYTDVMFDPVTIYGGPDGQFGSVPQADRAELAAFMQTEFRSALQKQYELTTESSPHTLRIHVTLTGIETSTPVLSPLTKIAPVGLVVNTVQTVRGKQAAFSGSVSYAVEIYDSVSDRLLRTYVEKQYPWAENIAASFGSLGAAKAGVRNGAQDMLEQLH